MTIYTTATPITIGILEVFFPLFDYNWWHWVLIALVVTRMLLTFVSEADVCTIFVMRICFKAQLIHTKNPPLPIIAFLKKLKTLTVDQLFISLYRTRPPADQLASSHTYEPPHGSTVQ